MQNQKVLLLTIVSGYNRYKKQIMKGDRFYEAFKTS